jgi:hypothetical protein
MEKKKRKGRGEARCEWGLRCNLSKGGIARLVEMGNHLRVKKKKRKGRGEGRCEWGLRCDLSERGLARLPEMSHHLRVKTAEEGRVRDEGEARTYTCPRRL